jgi:large subunit ribosomal protein L23
MAIFGTKTEEEKKTVTAKTDAGSLNANSKIPMAIIMPRVSEKAGRLAQENKYVFKVKRDSNKVEIKKAIENSYKVKVVQVNIINNQGKDRNFGQRSGRTSAFKKAIVTLKKGDKIEGLMDVV